MAVCPLSPTLTAIKLRNSWLNGRVGKGAIATCPPGPNHVLSNPQEKFNDKEY